LCVFQPSPHLHLWDLVILEVPQHQQVPAHRPLLQLPLQALQARHQQRQLPLSVPILVNYINKKILLIHLLFTQLFIKTFITIEK